MNEQGVLVDDDETVKREIENFGVCCLLLPVKRG